MTSPRTWLAFALASGLAAILLGPTVARAQPSGGAGALGPESIVAVVNGTPITLAQVDKAAGIRVQVLAAEQAEVRRQALDRLIDQALFESDAARGGAGSSTAEPASAESAPLDREQLLNAAAEVIRQRNEAASGTSPSARELRVLLERALAGERRRRLLAEVRAKAQVAIYLRPISVDMDLTDDPVLGPADAPVTVAVFSDFQCPYCARSAPLADQVVARFPGQVRVVFRDFPLSIHKEAALAAEAGGCANAQGRFWALHDLMFANQQQLGKDRILAWAQQSGLDARAFAACLDSKRFSAEWRRDQAEGEALGVTGTPTWFVNGRRVGAVTMERLETLIEQALETAKTNQTASRATALDR
jgi:protein-disulfide isomerase